MIPKDRSVQYLDIRKPIDECYKSNKLRLNIKEYIYSHGKGMSEKQSKWKCHFERFCTHAGQLCKDSHGEDLKNFLLDFTKIDGGSQEAPIIIPLPTSESDTLKQYHSDRKLSSYFVCRKFLK